MHRCVSTPLLIASLGGLIVGCGGAGTTTTTAMTPTDPTVAKTAANATSPELAYKLNPGLNTPLGPLKALSPKSDLDKPAGGKLDPNGAAKLAKLGKEGMKLDAAYSYTVADSTAPRATVGESAATVPFPADAKANPDGSVWIVDADTRRLLTLTGIKRTDGKPTTVADAPTTDLVHPTADAAVPPFALLARPDEASTGVTHALRILVKGVGAEGAPAAGARIRLKKSVSEKDVPLLSRALVRALKKYGATLGVGTSDAPALSALADVRWTKDDLKAFGGFHMSDFELIAAPDKGTKTADSGKNTK